MTACLYANPNGGQTLVATAVFTVPGIARPPTPAPTSTSAPAQVAPPLTIGDARANLPSILRSKFGGRSPSRRHFKRDCYRLTTQKVRCRVRWDHGSWRYSGAVDIRNDPDDPENSILYVTLVHRARLHRTAQHPSDGAPAPNAPAAPAPSPSPSSSCDPSYSGACLKPNVRTTTTPADPVMGPTTSRGRSESWASTTTDWTPTVTGSAASRRAVASSTTLRGQAIGPPHECCH